MATEIATALRALADRIDSGVELKGREPTSCTVVLADGVECSATYIGRDQPAIAAGIFMLGEAIKRLAMASAGVAADALSTHMGSTH